MVQPDMATNQPTTMTTHTTHQRTTTTICHESSSEYYSSREKQPRNATPGPSNVHRTLTPELPATPKQIRVLQVMNPDPWASIENT